MKNLDEAIALHQLTLLSVEEIETCRGGGLVFKPGRLLREVFVWLKNYGIPILDTKPLFD